MRTLEGMAKAGEPLLREALEAMRAHQKAQDQEASLEEVERRRLRAESLYHEVVDFQLLATCSLPDLIH
ncbi:MULTISPECIES: hypothetical protein [Pseudomonas]